MRDTARVHGAVWVPRIASPFLNLPLIYMGNSGSSCCGGIRNKDHLRDHTYQRRSTRSGDIGKAQYESGDPSLHIITFVAGATWFMR